MDKKHNHECLICGATYYHCDDCAEKNALVPWRKICDTPDHYDVFIIIKKFDSGQITVVEAKSQLDLIGINPDIISNFKPSAKNILSNILKTDYPEELLYTESLDAPILTNKIIKNNKSTIKK